MSQRLYVMVLWVVLTKLVSAQSLQVPTDVAAYLQDENNAVTEDGLLPFNNTKTASFADFVMHNWKPLLANFDQIAPEPRQQCLIVASAEPLPPKEYVAFVNDLCDLKSEGKASSQAIWTVLWAGMNKSGFLAYNYDRPAVASIINKLEVIELKENPKQWTEYFKDLKSGQMKIHTVERKQRDGDSMPEIYTEAVDNPNPSTSLAEQNPSNSEEAFSVVDRTVSVLSRSFPWLLAAGGIIGLGMFLLKRRK